MLSGGPEEGSAVVVSTVGAPVAVVSDIDVGAELEVKVAQIVVGGVVRGVDGWEVEEPAGEQAKLFGLQG